LVDRRDHAEHSEVRDLDAMRIHPGIPEIRHWTQALDRQAYMSSKTAVDVISNENLVRADEASAGPTGLAFAAGDDGWHHHGLAMK
jgi:hypothetical protein